MKKDDPVRYHFICFPYINLGQILEFDFGFAKIWNFNAKHKEYVKDEIILDGLKKTFSNYKAHFGVVCGVGLISVGENDFREFNAAENQAADDARLILFISHLSQANTITRNVNTGHIMISSENYEKSHFSLVSDGEYITIYDGFVIPLLHGGVRIDKNETVRPWHVPTPGSFYVDDKLFKALIEFRSKKKNLFLRMISAIQIFFEGYYNSVQISHNSRILLQASAFETLLGTSTGAGREELKSFIKKFANYPEDRIYSYKSERRDKKIIEFGTIKEKWADRFFTLRNHISHGLVPKPDEYIFGKWQRHFDIALYFFVFCLKRKIEKGLRKDIFGDDVVWKSWVDDLQIKPQKFTGFEYNSYGRRTCKRAKRKF